MRRSLAVVVAMSLAILVAAPVEAVSVQRTFRTSFGSGGSNGSMSIDYYTNGTGRATYNLTGLRKNTSYHVEVWKGRCGSLKSIAKRIPVVTTDANGSAVASRTLSVTYAYPIWSANWSNLLAVRLVSGSSIKCGNISFTRATRVTVPGYGIDLPIVRGPSGYPYCNVAMYMGALSQPREPGVTFIYAHARKGMFLPLLTQYRRNGGRNLIGKTVNVYSSDSMKHSYRISWVKVMRSVQSAVTITSSRLWLQTSTGPNFSYPKLVISATRISSAGTTYAASHPKAHIVRCG
jgi:hypothetical protein